MCPGVLWLTDPQRHLDVIDGDPVEAEHVDDSACLFEAEAAVHTHRPRVGGEDPEIEPVHAGQGTGLVDGELGEASTMSLTSPGLEQAHAEAHPVQLGGHARLVEIDVAHELPFDEQAPHALPRPTGPTLCGPARAALLHIGLFLELVSAVVGHEVRIALSVLGAVRLEVLGGHFEIVEGERSEVLGDAYSFSYSDGHTPGLMLTRVETPRGPLTFMGDLIPGVPWVHVPITMGYDRYPELVIEEKQRMLERVAAEDGWAFYTHDATTAASKIALDERGRYTATDILPSLAWT